MHPGSFIRTEIIEAYGLSVTGAATILGVSRPTLSTFLNAKSDLSGGCRTATTIAQTRKRASQIKVNRFHPAGAVR